VIVRISVVLCVCALAWCLPAASARSQTVQYQSGQNVAPIYHGYEVNEDGSYTLWFGYMNRNYEERPDVPIGPDNMFEPGPPDRGQPTHFRPRLNKGIFHIVVPKEAAAQKLSWKLTVNGKTEVAVATFHRLAIIERKKSGFGIREPNATPNTPPVVRVEPGKSAISRGDSATFTLSATDDGLPENRRTRKPTGMTVTWTKYRGPGAVTFEPERLPVAEGKAVTIARFSEPGEYELQALVDDGSMLTMWLHCCWTTAQIRVTVRDKP
jgi:hypothetical protein